MKFQFFNGKAVIPAPARGGSPPAFLICDRRRAGASGGKAGIQKTVEKIWIPVPRLLSSGTSFTGMTKNNIFFFLFSHLHHKNVSNYARGLLRGVKRRLSASGGKQSLV